MVPFHNAILVSCKQPQQIILFIHMIQILNLGVRNVEKLKHPWIIEMPREALCRMNHNCNCTMSMAA